MNQQQMEASFLNKQSEKLLLAVKMEEDNVLLRNELNRSSIKDLSRQLDNDLKKNAFWINIYNAFFQILRKDFKMDKPDIFRKKSFKIANELFSLDDVEHGILRRYRYKYSRFHFANPFAPKLIKNLAVDKLDYRIHFALNCGAESCPPIAFYNPANLHAQLDLATQSFLSSETKFDHENKIVHSTTLFKWFHADFGGIKGIKKIFEDQLDHDISDYKIKYTEYSWNEALDNYLE